MTEGNTFDTAVLNITFLYDEDFQGRLEKILAEAKDSFESLGVKSLIININESAQRVLSVLDENLTINPKTFSDETYRNARGYGWEIGKGAPLASTVPLSPDNPFNNPDWWKDAGLRDPGDAEAEEIGEISESP